MLLECPSFGCCLVAKRLQTPASWPFNLSSVSPLSKFGCGIGHCLLLVAAIGPSAIDCHYGRWGSILKFWLVLCTSPDECLHIGGARHVCTVFAIFQSRWEICTCIT